jgi:hypothetical protein
MISIRFSLKTSLRAQLQSFIGEDFTQEQKSIRLEMSEGYVIAQEKEGCYVVTIRANGPEEAVAFLVDTMAHFWDQLLVRVGRGAFQPAIEATYNLSKK